MYLDDTNLLIIGDTHDIPKTLTSKAQTMINKWCNALWITGGCLRPDKCWWYLIQFEWLPNGKWRYSTTDNDGADIWIPDETKTSQKIERCEPIVSQKWK